MTARRFAIDLIPEADGLGTRVTREAGATPVDACRAALALLRAFALGATPEGRIAMASLARLADLEDDTGDKGATT